MLFTGILLLSSTAAFAVGNSLSNETVSEVVPILVDSSMNSTKSVVATSNASNVSAVTVGGLLSFIDRDEVIRRSLLVALRSPTAYLAYLLMNPDYIGRPPIPLDYFVVSLPEYVHSNLQEAADLKNTTTTKQFIAHRVAGLFAIGSELRMLEVLSTIFNQDLTVASVKSHPELGVYAAILMLAGLSDPVANPSHSFVGGFKNAASRLVQVFSYLTAAQFVILLLTRNTYVSGLTMEQVVKHLTGFAALWITRGNRALI